ncbi:ankyrin repeat and BTB/POZ domain-containing protein 2 [Amia ocellicauda]|uniref:ankyrin repeat and BTB/POZ domain-containing protein 2 n=1 Tax=Amia ocellicauda TaxID=2972642 RepID=UPI003463AFCD
MSSGPCRAGRLGSLMELRRGSPAKHFEDLTLDSGYGGMAGSCRSSVLSLSPSHLDAPPGPDSGLWTLPGDGPFREGLAGGVGCHQCVEGHPEGLEGTWPKLPPLDSLPWAEELVGAVVRRCLPRWAVSGPLLVRLSRCLGRVLWRLCQEARRLSLQCGQCSQHEVRTAAKLLLSWTLSEAWVAAGRRALSAREMSVDEPHARGLSARAGLVLPAGRLFRWLVEARVAPRVQEEAALDMAAGLQALLEELCERLDRQGPPGDNEAAALEQLLRSDPELWGLCQPYQHLLCGKTAYGVPVLPSYLAAYPCGSLGRPPRAPPLRPSELQNLEHSLLTCSVDSVAELSALVVNSMYALQRLGSHGAAGTFQLHFREGVLSWEPEALHCLFYYTHGSGATWDGPLSEPPSIRLGGERSEVTQPPLAEWLRVCVALAEHRFSPTVDSADVTQAARLLLPGADCPPRPLRVECCLYASRRLDSAVAERALRWNLAFRMLSCGRADLVAPAQSLLGPQGIDSINDQGMSPLMYSCANGDEAMVQVLLDSGAAVDLQVPGLVERAPCAHPETRRWTALAFATAFGHSSIAQLLLESGADVDGGGSEGEPVETPLQLAAAAGHEELVSLLLEHGADPLSGTSSKTVGATSLRGTSSAFSLAAAHGHRDVLRKLLSQPENDILTLEDMLAEGAAEAGEAGKAGGQSRSGRARRRALQEALYLSAEHGYLDIALELRQQESVPWTLHSWLQCVRTSFCQRRWDVTHSLLGDFSSLKEVYSEEMLNEGLPLLFDILLSCQSESTVQHLASILSCCYGPYPPPTVHDSAPPRHARLDPALVNSRETADLTFLVEGKPFYAHREVVTSASPSLQKLVSKATPSAQVEIPDIKYSTFQLVMQYLYQGGSEAIHIGRQDVLQVLQAAHSLCLRPLKKHCEMLCSKYLHPSDAATFYQQAQLCQARDLKAFCEGYFLKNLPVLLEVGSFRRLLLAGDGAAADEGLGHDLLRTLSSRMNAIHQPLAKETMV